MGFEGIEMVVELPGARCPSERTQVYRADNNASPAVSIPTTVSLPLERKSRRSWPKAGLTKALRFVPDEERPEVPPVDDFAA